MSEPSRRTDDEIDVAIVGAGAAGTYLAYRLIQARPDDRIAIFERSDRIGGRLWSVKVHGVDHPICRACTGRLGGGAYRRPMTGVSARRLPLTLSIATLTLLAACSATPGATTPFAPTDSAFPEPTFTLEPEPTDEPLDTSLPTEQPTNDIGDGRPSTVTVTIAGNVSGANGTHTATGLTRVCGNLQFNAGNPNGFNYEFPYEGEHNPKDVSFNADDLLPGTSTSTFKVDIDITTDQITPSIIADPGGTAGDAGTATRTEAGGTTTLVLHATNNRGETIDLTATCGPR